MKAQSYTFDLMLALSIILVVGVILASFTFTKQTPSPLRQQALLLADLAYSPFPHNWTNQTVVYPGFVSAHAVNTTLFERFMQLPENEVRDLTGVTGEYFVTVSSPDLSLNAGTPVDAQAINVYSVTRFASFNGSLASVEVIVWE